MSEYNLPVPDDMPWLNLSKEEVNELRNKKFQLTQYAKQKLRGLMNKEQQIADEQLNKCLEWVAFNLQPTTQRPTKKQLEKMKTECRMIIND